MEWTADKKTQTGHKIYREKYGAIEADRHTRMDRIEESKETIQGTGIPLISQENIVSFRLHRPRSNLPSFVFSHDNPNDEYEQTTTSIFGHRGRGTRAESQRHRQRSRVRDKGPDSERGLRDRCRGSESETEAQRHRQRSRVRDRGPAAETQIQRHRYRWTESVSDGQTGQRGESQARLSGGYSQQSLKRILLKESENATGIDYAKVKIKDSQTLERITNA